MKGDNLETDSFPPAGLSGEHWSEMNSFGALAEEERSVRYGEFRAEYADRPYALEQIDIFDNASPYGVTLKEYIEVLKNGDTERQTELEAWFEEHYPLTYKFGSTITS